MASLAPGRRRKARSLVALRVSPIIRSGVPKSGLSDRVSPLLAQATTFPKRFRAWVSDVPQDRLSVAAKPAGLRASDLYVHMVTTGVSSTKMTVRHQAEGPIDRRVADPAALALFQRVRRGTDAEQRYIFRLVSKIVGVQTTEDQDDAVEAARACMADLNLRACPTRERYRLWHRDQPADKMWPTAETAKQAFGTWTHLRAVVDGEPVGDLRDLLYGSQGSPLTDEQLLDGLRSWRDARPKDPLTFKAYEAWARKWLREDTTERLAVAPETFEGRFGSWLASLGMAGLLIEVTLDEFCRLAHTSPLMTDEELREHIQAADSWYLARYSRHITAHGLDEYRRERLAENLKAHRWEAVPGEEMISSRFGGSITEALVFADVLTPAEAAARRTNRGATLPLAELAAHVRAIAAVSGYADLRGMPIGAVKRSREAAIQLYGGTWPAHITITGRFEQTSWPATLVAIASTETDPQLVLDLSARYTQALASFDPSIERPGIMRRRGQA